jgi:hypothetical protein
MENLSHFLRKCEGVLKYTAPLLNKISAAESSAPISGLGNTFGHFMFIAKMSCSCLHLGTDSSFLSVTFNIASAE